MIKTYSPDSSPEDQQELIEAMKSTAEFLNKNPEANAFMQDPKTKSLSEAKFITRLLSIAEKADVQEAKNS